MNRIAIFSTTRAEFGILAPLLAEIEKAPEMTSLLFVGGSHLSPLYGHTIDEIVQRGFKISEIFDYLLDGNDSNSLAKGLSVAVNKVADIFSNYDFDLACILGDRYELLAIAANAVLFRKAILHIHGGERSEGVIDEQVRHMLTKAAHLHFVSCDEHAQAVLKMGEAGWRVYNTGALGVDNIVKTKKVEKTEIFKNLGLDTAKPTILLAYHPVTLEFDVSPTEQMRNIFYALGAYDLQTVVTGPNVEINRDKVISVIRDQVKKNPNVFYFDSLGAIKFHSLLPYCEFILGNSSSGIIEIPFYRIPTINIGDRQKGRIRHDSVIDTDYFVESIRSGIERALSTKFRKSLKNMIYRFGDGHAAEKMVEILKNLQIDRRLLHKKLDFPE